MCFRINCQFRWHKGSINAPLKNTGKWYFQLTEFSKLDVYQNHSESMTKTGIYLNIFSAFWPTQYERTDRGYKWLKSAKNRFTSACSIWFHEFFKNNSVSGKMNELHIQNLSNCCSSQFPRFFQSNFWRVSVTWPMTSYQCLISHRCGWILWGGKIVTDFESSSLFLVWGNIQWILLQEWSCRYKDRPGGRYTNLRGHKEIERWRFCLYVFRPKILWGRIPPGFDGLEACL